MENKKIPVTILTGFLGAGKTTLLNRIIKDNLDKKLAVIENEFGETGIDGALVTGVEDGIFELSNGCLCCTLNSDLVDVLEKIMKRNDQIDHLIVETTGIADPGPVAISFLSDELINKSFQINAIVTLVDAPFIEQQLENEDIACKQIAAADIILVNKTDKVDAYTIDTVVNIIRRMNGEAEIKECRYGEIEGINLLDLHAFDKEYVLKKKFENDYTTLKDKKFSVTTSKIQEGTSLLQNTKHLHHSSISSLSFTFNEPLDILKFKIWVNMALNIKTCPIYRAKGILNFRDIDEKIVFQAVNNQYVTESGGTWKAEETRESKIVFIGKNLPGALLEKGLKVCTWDKPFDPREFYEEINKY